MENNIMITNFETGENLKMTHDQLMFLIDSMVDYEVYLERTGKPAECVSEVHSAIMDLLKIS